jgi:hypothetical protein
MKTTDTITAALRSNVEQAKSKAGRLLAQDELDRYLAKREGKPHTPSPFARFAESLKP